MFSFVEEVVLDPFAGSGTTLIEAVNNQCYARGLEIDDNYIKNSLQRIEKECLLTTLEVSSDKISELENKHDIKEHN